MKFGSERRRWKKEKRTNKREKRKRINKYKTKKKRGKKKTKKDPATRNKIGIDEKDIRIEWRRKRRERVLSPPQQNKLEISSRMKKDRNMMITNKKDEIIEKIKVKGGNGVEMN